MAQHVTAAEALGVKRCDEIHRQDVARQRPDGACDDADGHHRQRHRRQDQVAHMRPVPLPVLRPARPRAHRRQPAQIDRENDDQHDAQPIVRHRHPGDRQRRHRPVQRRVAEISRQEPQEDADRKGDHRRRRRQQQRIADRAEDFGRDGAARRDRAAHLSLQQVADPDQVLHRHRLVQAVCRAHRGLLFGGGIDRHDGRQRVARRDLHQRETDDRHPEGHRQHQDQASKEIAEHVMCPWLGRTRNGRGRLRVSRPSLWTRSSGTSSAVARSPVPWATWRGAPRHA